MILANLIGCVSIVAYFVWLCIRGTRQTRQILSANSAQEILKNVLARRQFYFRQAVVSFISLAVLAGAKALLVLAGKFSAGVFTAVVFGTTSDNNLFDRIGWAGVLLMVASVVCWYQHLKSKHHFEVLYAFRKQLGLTELG